MFVLETGDALRGVAAAASVIDFTVHGLAGTTLTQLADGQLGNTEADIYAASGSTDVITSITLVNTDSVTRSVDLFLKPSGGTSRRLIPKSLSLKANYSLYFDGNAVKVYDGSGNLLTATTALAHASEHTDGTDDIQDATTGQKGLATAAQMTKLDGIATSADVTGSNPPQAHKASHQDTGGDELVVTALSGLLADDQHVLDTEVTSAAKLIKLDDFAALDNNTDLDFSTAAHGLVPKGTNVGDFLKDDGTWSAPAGGGTVDTSGTPVANDIARFTDADTIEGRSYAELKADLDLEIGTDILAEKTIGIADNNLVEVDGPGAGVPASGEYAKWTASGLEGKTAAELRSDINVADGAVADHGALAGLTDDDHTQYTKHSLATVLNDFLVASEAGTFVKKNLAETIIILAHASAHQDGGVDEINVAALSGTLADDQHIIDAEAVSAVEAAGLTFAENKGIILDAALSADEKWSGITEAGVAGATLDFGDCIYQVASDAQWELAKADVAATSDGKLGINVSVAQKSVGNAIEVLLFGKVRSDADYAFSVRRPVFISAATAGDLTTTAPTGTTNFVVRIVGYGNTADELFFCPDKTFVELA